MLIELNLKLETFLKNKKLKLILKIDFKLK